nr:MAG TPA_asm: hypothetical protein [Caudoviricetes sp.]
MDKKGTRRKEQGRTLPEVLEYRTFNLSSRYTITME